MKELLLMRHAKSSWKDPWLSDFDRPLNERGKKDAPRMGHFLKERGLVPDRVVASNAKRARKTAQKVAKACGCDDPPRLSMDLYDASTAPFFSVLSSLGDGVNRALLVAHNPGVEGFLEVLTRTYERMPTAAIAHIQIPIESWGELSDSVECELLNVWRPKELF